MTDDPSDKQERPVGYGAPPTATRFKPGQSGNPRGRPPKVAGQRHIVETVLREKQRLDGRSKGSRVSFTKLELALMTLKQMAVAGHQSATKLMTQILDTYGTQEVANRKMGYLVVPERLTKEEWVAKYSPKERPPAVELED